MGAGAILARIADHSPDRTAGESVSLGKSFVRGAKFEGRHHSTSAGRSREAERQVVDSRCAVGSLRQGFRSNDRITGRATRLWGRRHVARRLWYSGSYIIYIMRNATEPEGAQSVASNRSSLAWLNPRTGVPSTKINGVPWPPSRLNSAWADGERLISMLRNASPRALK